MVPPEYLLTDDNFRDMEDDAHYKYASTLLELLDIDIVFDFPLYASGLPWVVKCCLKILYIEDRVNKGQF